MCDVCAKWEIYIADWGEKRSKLWYFKMGPQVQPKCFRHAQHMRNNWELRKRGYLIRFGHTEALLLKKKDIKRPFFPPCRNWPIWGSVFSRVEILWLGPGSPFGASLLAALRPYLTPHWCCWLPCCCHRTLSCWPKTATIWIWHMFDVNINFQLVLGKLQKSLMLGSFCPDFPM